MGLKNLVSGPYVAGGPAVGPDWSRSGVFNLFLLMAH